MLPHLARVGALVNVANPLHVPQWQETQAAAAKASLRAFDHFAREKVEAVLVPLDVTFLAYGAHIAEQAVKLWLPTFFFANESVTAGGLLSYGPNLVENYRRAAIYVDKILRGANPGELAIERPTKFELAINLKTAEAICLTIPPTLLAPANEVIE